MALDAELLSVVKYNMIDILCPHGVVATDTIYLYPTPWVNGLLTQGMGEFGFSLMTTGTDSNYPSFKEIEVIAGMGTMAI